MNLSVNKVGKRFLNTWIFRDISLSLKSSNTYALVGHNGSGKSTLLQILAGYLSPSEGEVSFVQDGVEIKRDDIHRYLSFCSPYTELIEELTLEEHIKFHNKFRPFVEGLDARAVMQIMNLDHEWDKTVRFFSSGMKQRLKLALSILSDSSFILLDEPSTNLDKQSTDWFLKTLERYRGDRLVIIASNVEDDLRLCNEEISVERYK
ncbi:MAG: ATP-binding cassette domain-containing protein [Saprospiraceae bacterium]|nr:ATP-binding cassette domain-containing protein [Saprospiraceae bacterium]